MVAKSYTGRAGRGNPGGEEPTMAQDPDITLYFSVASRSFIARWALEELGVPYRVETTDIRFGQQKAEGYLRINPMGKVPALSDHGVVVTEVPAICLYLADRYGYGALAPLIESPQRGPYLRWTVFSTAVAEPALWLEPSDDPAHARGVGWGDRTTVLALLEDLLSRGPWLLGDQFTAADIALGGILSIAHFNKKVPHTPVFNGYVERLAARPAGARAAQATWPPELFQTSPEG
jgi:glutathione S-transferase